jgi:hypothetical protein
MDASESALEALIAYAFPAFGIGDQEQLSAPTM